MLSQLNILAFSWGCGGLIFIEKGSLFNLGQLFVLLPVQSVLVLVVELEEAPQHVDGVCDGLLIGQLFLQDGKHLLLGEQLVLIGVVLLEGVQQFLLELLLLPSFPCLEAGCEAEQEQKGEVRACVHLL